MKYIITGTDQETGQPIELTVEAADVPTAAAMGAKKGVTVAGVRAVTQAAPPPVPPMQAPPMMPTRTATMQPAPPTPKKKGVRLWLSLVLFVAAVLAPAVPAVPLWAGIVVLSLVVLYLLPPVRRPVGSFLRVSPDRPAWRGFKLAAFVLIGLSLIGISSIGRDVVRTRQEFAAKQEAEKAAKAQADAEASAKVAGFVDNAKKSLDAGDVTKAEALLDEVLNVPAPNRGLAQSLRTNIRNSADGAWVLTTLVRATDEEFTRFRDGGTPPKAMDFGHAVLTDRAVALARPQIADATGKREEAKRQAEAAAEAARKAAEEQAAAAKQAVADKAAAEKAAKDAAQKEIKDKLDAYLAVLKLADVTIIESVSVERRGESWKATLTVKNIWHIRHYQVRLQDAQTLWQAWATIASPKDPDRARIVLVDGNGNEVGGSRALAGSLIWVQEK
jgi:hypothetical protein